jgi:hypothetical protein
MAKTRFRGFSVKNRTSRGLTARNQGLKHKTIKYLRGLGAN